ncbi:lytic murein transglycosylase [Nitratifractor sp.]
MRRTCSFILRSLLLLLFLSFPSAAKTIDYSKTPQGRAFAAKMHRKYGFDEGRILRLLARAKHQGETLARYQGRHKVGATDYSWSRYKHKILVPESVELGRRFMAQNRKWLSLASRRYKVSPEIITAFIRVESKFGLYGHEYPVWDSLVTLAFNKNRMQRFFRDELEKLLILARKNRLDVLKLRGSFAGAMGCVQQVPSIQLRYGVDLDGDGRKNPDSIADCIGSIAAFLHGRGWKDSRPTLVPARASGRNFLRLKSGYRSRYPLSTLERYGITPARPLHASQAYFIRMKDGKNYDLYLGDANYRIITRYNASKRYAVTIALYAQALKSMPKQKAQKRKKEAEALF